MHRLANERQVSHSQSGPDATACIPVTRHLLPDGTLTFVHDPLLSMEACGAERSAYGSGPPSIVHTVLFHQELDITRMPERGVVNIPQVVDPPVLRHKRCLVEPTDHGLRARGCTHPLASDRVHTHWPQIGYTLRTYPEWLVEINLVQRVCLQDNCVRQRT